MGRATHALLDAKTFDMSDEPSDAVFRLDTLEARFAQQERIIADLNEVVTAQWDQIDILRRQLQKLREEFQAIDVPREPEPPPPHY